MIVHRAVHDVVREQHSTRQEPGHDLERSLMFADPLRAVLHSPLRRGLPTFRTTGRVSGWCYPEHPVVIAWGRRLQMGRCLLDVGHCKEFLATRRPLITQRLNAYLGPAR